MIKDKKRNTPDKRSVLELKLLKNLSDSDNGSKVTVSAAGIARTKPLTDDTSVIQP